MHTITLLNRKGGVGKTSSVYHLGGTLAKGGRKVLVVDADPQANLTAGFSGPTPPGSYPRLPRRRAVRPRPEPFPEAVIRATPMPGRGPLPGSEASTPTTTPTPTSRGRTRAALRDFLAEVSGGSTWTLIDCPPTIYRASWSALAPASSSSSRCRPRTMGPRASPRSSRRWRRSAPPSTPVCPAGFVLTMFNKTLGVHPITRRGCASSTAATSSRRSMPLSKDYKESVAARLADRGLQAQSAAAKATAAWPTRCWSDAAAVAAPPGGQDRRVA